MNFPRLLATDFFVNLSKWNVIVALVFAVSAFVLMLFANKIVQKRYPDKTEEERLSVSLKIKIGCALVALCACLLAVLF